MDVGRIVDAFGGEIEMTENEKEKAAKPQSDWDGYIIPHRTAASSDI
jgi:hypothetical protein